MPTASAPDPEAQEARALRWSAASRLLLALLATFGYACVDAVLVILSGGGETAIGAALGYCVVTLVAVVALRTVPGRSRGDSVLVAAVLVLPTPIGMRRTAFRELLEGVPDRGITEPIHEAVRDLRREFGLPEPKCQTGKLGRTVYVELDFVVDPAGDWTVSDADQMRRRLLERLRRPGRLLWRGVGLHTDPAWDL